MNDRRQAEAVVSYIEQYRTELVDFLSELIRLRSVFPAGEYDAIAGRMRDGLHESGARVAFVTAPKDAIETRGLTYPRPNVVAALEGSGSGPVLLIPGVTYGAGSIGRVHKANEYLEIDELVRQTQIYALTALALCGDPLEVAR